MATDHPPMDGMLWCHVCKDYSFPKTGFGSVVALDCGHVEKRTDGKKPAEMPLPSTSVKYSKRAKSGRVYVQEPPPSRVEPVRQPNRPFSPSVSGTSNIANAVLDMLKK